MSQPASQKPDSVPGLHEVVDLRSPADSAQGRLRTAFTLLFWEGAFSQVYDTWTGPTYLSGLAGELHAPVFWVSLLCAAAWIGAVGQLFGAWFYVRVPSYKQYTV